MKYQTVYTTRDKNEYTVLKDLFEEEKIDFKILEDRSTKSGAGDVADQRFQVAPGDREKAEELLEQTGFLRSANVQATKLQRMPARKWIFFFLAALILIIFAILVAWFMNAGEA